MNESGVYTETDLQAFQMRLNELKQIIDHNSEAPDALLKLLVRKYDGCRASYYRLPGCFKPFL
jgi:hypothetical protein